MRQYADGSRRRGTSRLGSSDVLRSLGVLCAAFGLMGIESGCTSSASTIRLLDRSDSGVAVDAGSEPVSCRGDNDCPRNAPYCNGDEHACVECQLDSHCPSGMTCDDVMHVCKPRCEADTDCTGTERGICTPAGTCVQCETDDDCSSYPGTPKCNPANGSCVECLTQSDCAPTVCFDDCRVCSSDHTCVWHT